MSRPTHMRALLAGVVVALACASGPALGAGSPGGPAPLGKGWGRVVASGILASVDRAHDAVSVNVARTGTLATFEGGALWHQTTFAGTRTVHLVPASLLLDAGGHAIPLAAVRPGEPVLLWAVARPDATILALAVEVVSPQVRAGTGGAAAEAAPAGVVVRRAGSTLDLLGSSGRSRSVVMTPATVVRNHGRPVPESTVVPYDVLRVDGPVNSDGSLVATRVDVEFAAAAAARVSGPIEQSVTGIGGLVVEETMVATSAATYVIRDAARAELSQVAPGRPVMVYGVPVLAGATPIGLDARVVVVR